MANKALCTALLLLGLMSVASAGRTWDKDMHRHRHFDRKGSPEEECQGIIGIKYEVPPSMHKEFIKEWQRVEENTLNEKGIKLYDLKKDKDSNTCFFIYGEWESLEDFKEHYKSDYVQEFIQFLDENDIMFEMCPLKDVTEGMESYKRNRRHATEEEGAHILVKFEVPPSMQEEFVREWTSAAKAMLKEEDGITCYALRKVATTNHQYTVFGSWESLDAYQEHLETEHIKRLTGFLADRDIKFTQHCVEKLGKMEI